MTFETSIALFLVVELLAALRANDPDLFKRWLCGGVQDLGKPAEEEKIVYVELQQQRLVQELLLKSEDA